MFQARIYSPADTLHLTAEVTPYNIETLRTHLRRGLRDGARVSILVDPTDRSAFTQCASPWLTRLAGSGVAIAVGEATTPIKAGRRHHARRNK